MYSSGGKLRPVSALLRGVQIMEFDTHQANPDPVELEDTEAMLEEYLSPRRLQEIAGVEDLSAVTELSLRVNTSETSLGNFGHVLPNLKELRLDDSLIPCVRDLGSSLGELHTLWMQRCGLDELDGICSMVNVVELYLSYNCLTDLSPLALCDNLEILDVEGNNIDDISNVLFLSTCSRLARLTLEGNPVCLMASPDSTQMDYSYRETVHSSLPDLVYLDDELLSVDNVSEVMTDSLETDWAYLDELRNDALLDNTLNCLDEFTVASPDSHRISPSRPASGSVPPRTSIRPITARRLLTSRPVNTPKSALRPWTSLVCPKTLTLAPSTGGDTDEMFDSSSGLTSGQVVCGNPVKALLARRRTAASPCESAPATVMGDGGDTCDGGDTSESDLMSELCQWRKHHEQVLKRIEEDKAPQVLTVTPGELASDTASDESESDTEDVRVTSLPVPYHTTSQLTSHSTDSPSHDNRVDSASRGFRARKYKAQVGSVLPRTPVPPAPPTRHASQLHLDESFELEPDSCDARDQIHSPDSGFSSAISPVGSGSDLHQPTTTTRLSNHKPTHALPLHAARALVKPPSMRHESSSSLPQTCLTQTPKKLAPISDRMLHS